MSRETDYTRPPRDPVEYNRALYRKSPRERLYRINASRFQRGAPLLTDLSQAKLRFPVEEL
jgi:hypothetical protein